MTESFPCVVKAPTFHDNPDPSAGRLRVVKSPEKLFAANRVNESPACKGLPAFVTESVPLQFKRLIPANLVELGVVLRLSTIRVSPAKFTSLLTVKVPIEAPGPGTKLAPACTVRVPLIIPVPVKVAPGLTTTGPVPVADPEELFTRSVPATTEVVPL